jgi:hypothetical protein
MGKTPSGWWEASRGSASGCRRPVTGGAGAKMPQRGGIGCAGDEGDVAAPQWSAELLMPWFRGAKVSFPPGGFPRRVRVSSGSASGPDGAVRPSHQARARAWLGAHTPAQKGKRRGERDKVAD